MKRPYLLGCDPGYSGALAVIDITASREGDKSSSIVKIIDMPTYKIPASTSKMKTRVDPHALAMELGPYASRIGFAVIEDPGSRPKQGLESTYRFGEACGVVMGVLAGMTIPVKTIRPAAWKLALGLSSDKEDSLRTAKACWPEALHYFKRKKDNDRAEACLMTIFAQKYLAELVRIGCG